MTAGIYALWFGRCKRPYIGQSRNIENRFAEHQKSFKKGTTHNSRILNAYNKYKSCSLQILEICKEQQLNNKEVWWFNYFGGFANTLNCREPGDVQVMSEETRKRMSKAQTGKKHSEATKAILRDKQLGRKASEETKIKIRLGVTGTVWSEEAKLNLSNKMKEHKAKLKARKER